MKFRLKLAFIGMLLATSSFAQKKPNIIVFMVDDMGWQDTSYPFDSIASAFNKIYNTPNMERMAKESIAFTNAYSTPVCTPSRVSLITGMNASQHHVTNWTAPMKDRPTGRKDDELQEPIWNHNGLSPIAGIANTIHATSLSQILKDNGYFTIHAGKAHWGSAGTPGSNPYSLGFVVNIAGTSTGRPASYWGTQNFGRNEKDYHGVENLQEYFEDDIYLTEALTREAIKTLDYPIDNKIPFFLNLGHYAIHDPLMEDKRYYQKYIDRGISKNEAKYASMIEGMDKSLGDVLDYLASKKALDNTYIVFISDNGGLSLTYTRDGMEHTHNKPLRSGKGSIYEGGIRVPLLIKGIKGNIKGRRENSPVIIEDIFPTVLDMANIKNPTVIQHIDGKSQINRLRKHIEPDTTRDLIFHIPNKWIDGDGDGFNYRSAIRKGDFKLIYSYRSNNYELYNVEKDLGEQHNLIDDNRYDKIVEDLKNRLDAALKKYNAPVPVKISSK
ncbi:sulfatase [Sphingobacterium nematocida]|nr:sulfatase [Sphingobacterium nematocida]